jgi:hypothetical protein
MQPEGKYYSVVRHRNNAIRCFDEIETFMMKQNSPDYKYRIRPPILGKNILGELLRKENYSVFFMSLVCDKTKYFPAHRCNDKCENGDWMVIMDNICFTGESRHTKITDENFTRITDQLTKETFVTMIAPIKGRQELLQKLAKYGYTVKLFKGCQRNEYENGLCGHINDPCSEDKKIDWMTITDPEPDCE